VIRRLFAALLLASTVTVAGALAFLRTDFVATNLCAYAVATIEETTHASVRVASCQVDPVKGTLVIDGLHAGDPGGQLQVEAARISAEVEVRPLQQRLKLVRLDVDHPEVRLTVEPGPPQTKKRDTSACLPDVLDRFELGRVRVRKAAIDIAVKDAGVRVQVPRIDLQVHGKGEQLSVAVATRTGTIALPGRSAGLLSLKADALLDLRGAGSLEVGSADVIGTEATVYLKGKLSDLCNPQIEATANVHVDDLASATARLLPGALQGVKGGLQVDGILRAGANGKLDARGDLRIKGLQLEGLSPGDARASFRVTPEKVSVSKLAVTVGKGEVRGGLELALSETGVPLAADVTIHQLELAELLHKLGIPRSLPLPSTLSTT
jgi:hypothetical protein